MTDQSITTPDPATLMVDDPEIEAMKQRVLELEQEAAKLRTLQEEAERELSQGTAVTAAGAVSTQKEEIDTRSVYVGNVDYSTTPEELQALFQPCGTINRVTILCNKITGQPKGFAYVEFAEAESVDNAVKLEGTALHDREIKVTPKRTNIPMFNGPGGRGFSRGRRPFRGGYRGRSSFFR
ncbi:hypothetical protein H4R33_003493 [Dimargaris cristalligena]|nr:hypothetical protein H4R33_003493 [Dimargaris cristalligena]